LQKRTVHCGIVTQYELILFFYKHSSSGL